MSKERIAVKTPMFRGMFVNLVTARKTENDDGTTKEQFGICIMLPKTEKTSLAFVKELMAAIGKASAQGHGKEIPRDKLKHYPIKDGDKLEQDYFHGHYVINANSNFKPSAVDVKGNELVSKDELYSGAWYKAKISPYAWTNGKGGKGVSINLDSVLKVKDDKRVGGGSDAKDDFADDIDEDAETADVSSDDDDLLG